MRRPDTNWVWQKGKSALKTWEADEFQDFMTVKYQQWGGKKNRARKRAINQRWHEDIQKAKAASLAEAEAKHPKTPGVIITEVDERPNAYAVMESKPKALPKKMPRFVLTPSAAHGGVD